MLQDKEEEHLCALTSGWKTKAEDMRDWSCWQAVNVLLLHITLHSAVCILKLFTRRMRSFFSLLEMKQHVVEWLSHSPEPFKDGVLNAVLGNLVAKI